MSLPRWPVLRASILAVVIAVHGLAAAPLPQTVRPAELASPVAAEEVAAWAGRLTALGYTIDADRLGERVVAISGAIDSAHRGLLSPFQPVFRLTGTGQAWPLFANPDTHPGRLVVRVHRESGWEILYQRLDPEHAWSADVLSYRRVRALYEDGSWRAKATVQYRRFAGWLSRRIFDSDPAVDQVEVSTVRTHTTLPGQKPDDRVEVLHPVTLTRTP